MSLEEHKEHAFDAYCRKLLRNEAINIRIEYAQRSKRETNFSALTRSELAQLQYTDQYAPGRRTFHILDMAVEVKDPELGRALAILSEGQRSIILLSYLLGMTDPEIAQQLNLSRSTVQLRRTSILKELRKLMEGFTYEQ